MQKTVFLHIGGPKTGTTTFQRIARGHRDRLLQQGVLYPEAFLAGPAHHKLAVALRQMTTPRLRPEMPAEAALDKLTRIVADAPVGRILLSSEFFLRSGPDAIEQLSSALSAFRTRVMVTVRAPDALYLSSFTQNAKLPENNYHGDLKAHLDTPWDMQWSIRMNRALAPWFDVFGNDALHVFEYEAGNPVLQLIDHVGVALPDGFVTSQHNASPPQALCDLMMWSKKKRLSLPARRWLYRFGNLVFTKGRRLTLSVDERRRIRMAAAPETDALFARLNRPNPYLPDGLSA